jgi:hypothetical protein
MTMTLDEVRKRLRKLVESRREIAEAYKRKKWRPSEKAAAIADVELDIIALQMALSHIEIDIPRSTKS